MPKRNIRQPRRKRMPVRSSDDIHIKKIRGKRYYVKYRRDNGKLEEKRLVKGSGLKISDIRQLYKQNKTFYPDRKAIIMANFKEITYLQDSKAENRISKKPVVENPRYRKLVQYVVQGYYKTKLITARSTVIGKKDIRTFRDARDDAWKNFLGRLSNTVHGGVGSDADEGLLYIDKVTDIKEGWVRYV